MINEFELLANKVIEATKEVSLSEEEQASIQQLFKLGGEQGFITLDDIASQFPESEASLPVIERVYDMLLNAGIEIIDDEEVSEKKPAVPLKEAEAEKENENKLAEVSAIDAIDSGDSVGLYLSQVGRVPLLTRDEEVELAKRIERGRRVRNNLARGPVSPKQRAKFQRFIQDGMAAREHLIMANSRLVISVAKKYVGRGVPLLDMIQEGHVGLMRAVKKFDYRRGHKFSTYATWWIRQAVTRLVADHGRTIRIPVHMGDRINRMLRSRHKLTQELGREPVREELAECLEVSPQDVDYMLRVAQRPLSLEKPTEQEGDAVIGDFIEDQDAPAPEEITLQEILEERVQELLETLPHREALVLRLRYGLESGEVHTLKEIGEKMGITRERVRQIEAQALRRLRNPGLRRELVDFVRT
ncbi:MAG: sigma-70 family RNA polymerase sigma factor [Anaerolineales bacterium]|nr:MAG: sigma-70 family RNA polymerase sigma factor [Anaerolineales bacterium]